MIRAGSLAALLALVGVAPFEYETMPPDRSALMDTMWQCCYPTTNPKRGPVVGGYALSLSAPSKGHVGDLLALNLEIQNIDAPAQRLSVAPRAVFELTIAGPGRTARVWLVRGRFQAFPAFELPPGNAERVRLDWLEDYELFPVPGRYALRLSRELLVGGGSVTLSSNDAIITISAALPGNRFVPTPSPSPTPFTDTVVEQCRACEAESRRTPTGKVVDGLALSLTLPNAVVRLGAPLPAIVEVRNASREVKYVSFGLWITDYDFEVRDVATGKVVPRDPNVRLLTITRMPWPAAEAVPPGRSIFGWIDINHIYPIKTAGTYRIRITRGRPRLQTALPWPWTTSDPDLDSTAVLVHVVQP